MDTIKYLNTVASEPLLTHLPDELNKINEYDLLLDFLKRKFGIKSLDLYNNSYSVALLLAYFCGSLSAEHLAMQLGITDQAEQRRIYGNAAYRAKLLIPVRMRHNVYSKSVSMFILSNDTKNALDSSLSMSDIGILDLPDVKTYSSRKINQLLGSGGAYKKGQSDTSSTILKGYSRAEHQSRLSQTIMSFLSCPADKIAIRHEHRVELKGSKEDNSFAKQYLISDALLKFHTKGFPEHIYDSSLFIEQDCGNENMDILLDKIISYCRSYEPTQIRNRNTAILYSYFKNKSYGHNEPIREEVLKYVERMGMLLPLGYPAKAVSQLLDLLSRGVIHENDGIFVNIQNNSIYSHEESDVIRNIASIDAEHKFKYPEDYVELLHDKPNTAIKKWLRYNRDADESKLHELCQQEANNLFTKDLLTELKRYSTEITQMLDSVRTKDITIQNLADFADTYSRFTDISFMKNANKPSKVLTENRFRSMSDYVLSMITYYFDVNNSFAASGQIEMYGSRIQSSIYADDIIYHLLTGGQVYSLPTPTLINYLPYLTVFWKKYDMDTIVLSSLSKYFGIMKPIDDVFIVPSEWFIDNTYKDMNAPVYHAYKSDIGSRYLLIENAATDLGAVARSGRLYACCRPTKDIQVFLLTIVRDERQAFQMASMMPNQLRTTTSNGTSFRAAFVNIHDLHRTDQQTLYTIDLGGNKEYC